MAWPSGLGGVEGRGRATGEGGGPGRRRQRAGMAWPSGLGGVEGRGRASTHGAFSWVGGCKSSGLNPTKKMILSFFGAGMGGPWSEATE